MEQWYALYFVGKWTAIWPVLNIDFFCRGWLSKISVKFANFWGRPYAVFKNVFWFFVSAYGVCIYRRWTGFYRKQCIANPSFVSIQNAGPAYVVSIVVHHQNMCQCCNRGTMRWMYAFSIDIWNSIKHDKLVILPNPPVGMHMFNFWCNFSGNCWKWTFEL